MLFEKFYTKRLKTFSYCLYYHARQIKFVKLTKSKFYIQSNKKPIISTADKSVQTFYFSVVCIEVS